MAHAVCEGLQRVPLVLLSGELTAGLSHLTDSERPHSRPPPQCLSHSLPNLFLFSRLRVRFEWGVCSKRAPGVLYVKLLCWQKESLRSQLVFCPSKIFAAY